MNILVTGACGFVGSYVCRALADAKHTIIGLDDFSSSTDECKQVSSASCTAVVEASILDADAVQSALRKHHIDLVVHLAARPGVAQSIDNPVQCMETNVVGTETVLAAMKSVGASKIVFASSSTVYSGLSPYGLSKQFCERLCEISSKLDGVDAVMLRLFSVYGPRLRCDLAMNKLADTLRPDCGVFRVRGLASKLSRDYTYAEDVAQAFVLAAELLQRKHGGFFSTADICNGKPFTLRQVIDALEGFLQLPLSYVEYDMPEDWEPASTCGDPNAAKELLSWKPKTEFYEGLQKFAEWWKQTRGKDISELD